MLSVGLIGAGRVGIIRARVIGESKSANLAIVADSTVQNARKLASLWGAKYSADWRDAISHPGLDAVIVATPTAFHAVITLAAFEKGLHVLCEKPLALTVEQAAEMVRAGRRAGKTLKTGFNYRHMPHVLHAKALITSGSLGEIMYVRSHFGHGGRPGYESEWHTDSRLSGGGVLLEQGIHVLDLFRFLVAEPTRVFSENPCLFWRLERAEDNSFCLLQTATKQTAQIHVSWTQWINTFRLEIFGTEGAVELQGRDGHYGAPEVKWIFRNPDHSRPVEHRIQFQAGNAWQLEWEEFLAAIQERREPIGSGSDGLRAQQIVGASYRSSQSGTWVDVEPMIPASGNE